MKALRWHGRKDLRVDEVPIPQPGHGEVLIKVAFSGICGSEVHEYVAGPIFIPLEPHPVTGQCAPQIMGHEFGGHIYKMGSEVTNLSIGDLVTVNPLLACDKCEACAIKRPNLCKDISYYGLIGDGGHAEFAVVKAANCVSIPEGVPVEYVAFGEPAGVAFHVINQAAIKPESSVAVVGGGPIGQMVVQYARLAGASKVFMTETALFRIQKAKEIGVVDDVFNPVDQDVIEEIKSRTGGRGVDYAIECCGGGKTGMLEDTAAQAIEMTREEGTTVIVGTFSEPTMFHFNNIVLMERRVIGSWVWRSQEELSRAMQMIIEGKVKVVPLITKKIRIDRALEDGIKNLLFNNDDQMKILIDFT